MSSSVLGYRTAVPVLAALMLFAACGSTPPTRFYTLSDTTPQVAPPTGVGSIAINSVTIPGEIDRPEIVRLLGSDRLSISGLDRWAAPLDEIIRRVLADDIARRVPAPVPGREHSVSVDIREFYGDGACDVTLRAVWRLKPAGGQPAGVAQPVTEDIRVPSSGACPGTLPQTMSTALGQLSDRIIAAVAR
jgi:uncharacterized lipoprotein YmbA